jgi:N6-adenosine-specific RNA methylase IME4
VNPQAASDVLPPGPGNRRRMEAGHEEYPLHPAAALFPVLAGAELEALAADIAEHGLLNPIVLEAGMVLDGRNRQTACRVAGAEPRFEQWVDPGCGPAAWVISQNLYRRHLNESQRAMIADRVATLPPGANQHSSIGLPSMTQAAAAAMLNVSVASVKRARRVREHGAPQLVAAVERGALAVSAAAELADVALGDQVELLAQLRPGTFTGEIGANEVRDCLRMRARAAHAAAVGDSRGTLPDGPFDVALVDPPWRYEHSESGSREIENHYPTLPLEDICALPIADLVAPASLLFLWATSPKLREAMEVIERWGFTYRSSLVWVKDKIGTGDWARGRHEFVLIARRGDMPVPAGENVPDSVIEVPRGAYSAKPAVVHEIIERMYPNARRVELFARKARPGWTAWGNEVTAARPGLAS